jgi:hypothetical protein
VRLVDIANEKVFGKGTSKAAIRRRAERTRGRVLAGKPGDVMQDSRGRHYAVARDGSLRRLEGLCPKQ